MREACSRCSSLCLYRVTCCLVRSAGSQKFPDSCALTGERIFTDLEEQPIIVTSWSTSDAALHTLSSTAVPTSTTPHTHTFTRTLTNAHTHENETPHTTAGNGDVSPVGSGRYAVPSQRTSRASSEAISVSLQATSLVFQAPPPVEVTRKTVKPTLVKRKAMKKHTIRTVAPKQVLQSHV